MTDRKCSKLSLGLVNLCLQSLAHGAGRCRLLLVVQLGYRATQTRHVVKDRHVLVTGHRQVPVVDTEL